MVSKGLDRAYGAEIVVRVIERMRAVPRRAIRD
jgi:hypothetical protein